MSLENESVNADIENEVVETTEVETPSEAVDHKQDEVDSGFIDFNALPEEHRGRVKTRIDQDFRKAKDLERKYQEEAKKAREYEAKIAELSKPKEVAPPDPESYYDNPDQFKQQQEQYAESIRQQSEYSYQQKAREQEVQQETQRAAQEKSGAFMSRATKAGIDAQKVIMAGNVVGAVLPEDTQNYLIDHEFGGQLVVSLAENPMELQSLANLSPYQVGLKLDEMSKAYKRKITSSAPSPDEPIRGSGVSAKDTGPVGAKFE